MSVDLMDGEEIIDVPGYEGLYAASNLGRIWSYPSKSNMNRHGMWLSPGRRGKDRKYLHIVPRKKHNRGVSVHRMVALAWLGNPEDDFMQINHIDGDTTNNCVDNLEWVTPSDNMKHAYSSGIRTVTDGQRSAGKRTIVTNSRKRLKLTLEQAKEIRSRHKSRFDTKLLANEFGVGTHVIRRIAKGETYNGY